MFSFWWIPQLFSFSPYWDTCVFCKKKTQCFLVLNDLTGKMIYYVCLFSTVIILILGFKMAPDAHSFGVEPLTCHAWNGDKSRKFFFAITGQ